ncbi:MAG: YezD family protein [Gemmataceae bacterium]
MPKNTDRQPQETGSQPVDPAWDHIRDALRGLRYGEVTVIVQDGLVIQIERTEKKRLRPGQRQR